jgi:acetyl esterase/lipase
MSDVPQWERRYRAPKITLPSWSPDAPDRFVFASNESGSWQISSWEPASGLRRRLTDDTVGITDATPTPDGSGVVWFFDAKGDEFGHYVAQPFEGGDARPLVPGIPDGWPQGLALREDVVAVAQGEREGFAVYVSIDGEPARELFRHREIVTLGAAERPGWSDGGISTDGALVCLHHSEHGDPLHAALRVLDVRTGATVGDLWDGAGKGLTAWAWSPVLGDQRVAFVHELEDRERVGVWDPVAGTRTNLSLERPGDVGEIWGWYPDASALLVSHTHDGRDELLRLDVEGGAATTVEPARGTFSDARVRPDATVWFRRSDGAHQSRVLDDRGDEVIVPEGDRAPEGRPYESWEFSNPAGQRVHGFLVTPGGEGPFPLFMLVHGGPTWLWLDAYDPDVQAFVDAGFAVALVNYRGSLGYGARWRDMLIKDPGLPETEDVLAGAGDLVARGMADPDRLVIGGWSWGGYLTLLGIGLHPDRWAAAIAGVPVADYIAAFEDEAPSLQAMDRGLFGGDPGQAPDMYRERSPLTYVDRVRTPLLILAGENDSRCPIRQIDNYVEALRARGRNPEVYRYDTGHSSFIVDEQVRQMRVSLEFLARTLPRAERS